VPQKIKIKNVFCEFFSSVSVSDAVHVVNTVQHFRVQTADSLLASSSVSNTCKLCGAHVNGIGDLTKERKLLNKVVTFVFLHTKLNLVAS